MVSMCKEKKAYIQPSVELYAVTHILLDGSQNTPTGTPPLVDGGGGGDPYTEGLAKGFDFNNIEWYSVNQVGDKITKEFDIDTRMWYE